MTKLTRYDAWNLLSQVFLLLSCIIPCKFRHLSTLTLPLLLEIMPPCFVLRCTLYLHNSDKDFSWGCSESLLLCRLSVVVASGSYSSLQCVGSSCGGLSCWGAQALGTGAQQLWHTAQLPRSMWDLLQPVSPTLAGRFLSTVPLQLSKTRIFKLHLRIMFVF